LILKLKKLEIQSIIVIINILESIFVRENRHVISREWNNY
jgi:hypothetical protein